MSKPRVVKDYDKLSEDVQNKIKFVYPKGFSHQLVSFTTKDGEKKLGLPFETDDYYYLIRMSESRAIDIIDEDDDFDDDGNLKDSAREEFGERFKDMNFIDNNANEDNEFGDDDDDHDPYAEKGDDDDDHDPYAEKGDDDDEDDD